MIGGTFNRSEYPNLANVLNVPNDKNNTVVTLPNLGSFTKLRYTCHLLFGWILGGEVF